MRGLRTIADYNLRNDFLRRYVCRKYSMPPTDPRYLAFTREELWLEWLEDTLESDPSKVMKMLVNSEEGVKYVTGNKQVDLVEEASAKGDTDEIERLLDTWGSGGKAPMQKVVVGDEVLFEDAYEDKK